MSDQVERVLVHYEKKIKELEQKLAESEKRLEIAKEALEYYANRMGMGGTAREALKKIGL